MFKLIKLAIYGLLGYALYEFFRGISTESVARQMEGAGAGGHPRNEGNEGQAQSRGGDSRGAKAANAQWSGPGEGQEGPPDEARGIGAHHKVGRGVVSR